MRVLHLVGSAESEHLAALSRLYAADCLQAVADPARYEPVIAYVEPGGTWRFPAGLSRAEREAAPRLEPGEAIAHLGALAPDVAVPQLFCRPGMTHYRALLDVLGIPYVGNRPGVMALAADKAKAKAVAAAAGVAVPHGEVVRAGELPTLAPPFVVKPLDADNSAGLSLVRALEELPSALAAAFAHASAALVEAYVPAGREVRVGLLERDGELVCLPLEEYPVGAERPLRIAADKLAPAGDGELRLMAKDAASAWIVTGDDPVVPAVHALARACHVALGCRHHSLFDVRIDPAGTPWLLEASLYCSFAAQSVISVMARAAGLGVPELFAAQLGEALA